MRIQSLYYRPICLLHFFTSLLNQTEVPIKTAVDQRHRLSRLRTQLGTVFCESAFKSSCNHSLLPTRTTRRQAEPASIWLLNAYCPSMTYTHLKWQQAFVHR